MPPLPRGRDGLVRPCRASRSRPASSRYTHNDRCNRNDDPSPLHPFRPVIVSVGEEESAKLNYNKLFEHDRRADGALFVTLGTCLRGYKGSQIMYCLLLLAFRPLLKAQGLMLIEEGRPSRWRDGLAHSFVHDSTHHCRRKKGSKLLARGTLGPFALGVGSVSPRAPETVQVEHRMA